MNFNPARSLFAERFHAGEMSHAPRPSLFPRQVSRVNNILFYLFILHQRKGN